MARFEGVEGNLAVLAFVIHSCVWYGMVNHRPNCEQSLTY